MYSTSSPCPFCGERDATIAAESTHGALVFCAVCGGCGARGPKRNRVAAALSLESAPGWWLQLTSPSAEVEKFGNR